MQYEVCMLSWALECKVKMASWASMLITFNSEFYQMNLNLVKNPANDPSHFPKVVCWHFNAKKQATKITKSSVSKVIKPVLHRHKSIR